MLWQGEQFGETWEATGQAINALTALVKSALTGMYQSALQTQQITNQFGTHRDRHFSGSGWGWGPPVRGKIDQRGIGFMADGRDQRNGAGSSSAHHLFFIESPKILNRATAASDNQNVGPWHGSADFKSVEAFDCRGDLACSLIALHQNWPYQHVTGEPVGEPVQDIANHCTRGRGHNADDLRQIGQGSLALLGEQTLGHELLAAFLKQGHEGANASGFHAIDHDLVARLARESGHLAGTNHFKALFWLDFQPRGHALPDHPVEHGFVVFEVEIDVARAGPADTTKLTAHADIAEGFFDRSFERKGKLRNAEFR